MVEIMPVLLFDLQKIKSDVALAQYGNSIRDREQKLVYHQT